MLTKDKNGCFWNGEKITDEIPKMLERRLKCTAQVCQFLYRCKFCGEITVGGEGNRIAFLFFYGGETVGNAAARTVQIFGTDGNVFTVQDSGTPLYYDVVAQMQERVCV